MLSADASQWLDNAVTMAATADTQEVISINLVANNAPDPAGSDEPLVTGEPDAGSNDPVVENTPPPVVENTRRLSSKIPRRLLLKIRRRLLLKIRHRY